MYTDANPSVKGNVDTLPTFTIVKSTALRFILVLDVSGSMDVVVSAGSQVCYGILDVASCVTESPPPSLQGELQETKSCWFD